MSGVGRQWVRRARLTRRIRRYLRLHGGEKLGAKGGVWLLAPAVAFAMGFCDGEGRGGRCRCRRLGSSRGRADADEAKDMLGDEPADSPRLVVLPVNDNSDPERVGGGSHWCVAGGHAPPLHTHVANARARAGRCWSLTA